MKRLCAARIDELADSNEPAIILQTGVSAIFPMYCIYLLLFYIFQSEQDEELWSTGIIVLQCYVLVMFVVALYKGHGGYRDSSHFRSFATFWYIATWNFNKFIVELKLK